jgi:hypothetical protein
VSKKRSRSQEGGQALVELLVVLPVLLLLLLAAADMGKLFVISGKSEIAARYTALRHFRAFPFGDLYPAQTRGQEIERIFFDDALDDSGLPEAAASEADDPDVTYEEIGDDELIYAPLDLANPLLVVLWDALDLTDPLVPIRGVRSTFAYDLPSFPYGREHPMKQTLPLQDEPSESRLAASLEVTGNFVILTDSFSGGRATEFRLLLEAGGFLVGLDLGSPAILSLMAILWLIFLP